MQSKNYQTGLKDSKNNYDMNNQELQLTLTLEEINKTLAALGNLPYAQVFALIDKIREQAEDQVKSNQKKLKIGH